MFNVMGMCCGRLGMRIVCRVRWRMHSCVSFCEMRALELFGLMFL